MSGICCETHLGLDDVEAFCLQSWSSVSLPLAETQGSLASPKGRQKLRGHFLLRVIEARPHRRPQELRSRMTRHLSIPRRAAAIA